MVKRVPKLHTEFDPPVDPGIDCSVESSRTQQCFREECDINVILTRYSAVELADLSVASSGGLFADVGSLADFHTAENILLRAREVFDELPLKIRRRFGDDPRELLAFLDDPSNRDEAIELGLVNKAPVAPAAGLPDSPLAAGAAGAASAPGASSGASQRVAGGV